MTRHFTLLAAATLFATAAFAKGNISGKALEKDTEEPVAFATVQLLNAKTGKPLPIGVNTDADGQFTIPGVADGNYILRISSVGSIDQERHVSVKGANINLGTLHLANDTKLLQEVVVEGVRSQMRFELDKKVFQVDANIMAAGQSASELLESIPSVEVDQDGEVSLRGNSSVTVWINGKESGMTAENRAQILEQIPGESIERIEVITNPSAKFSPEGTAGIINIILKKDRRGGYFGSAEIGGNSQGGGNASFNFNWSNSKWDAFASVGFRMRHNKSGSLTRREYTDGSFLNSDATGRGHGNNIFIRAGLTYHLTDKDEFYVNGFGMFGHRWGKTTTSFASSIPGQWTSNTQWNHYRSDNRGAHAEIGYTHRWSDNHQLDIMAAYNHWGGPQWNNYLQRYAFPDEGLNPDDDYNEQDQTINVNNYEAKIDYTNQILPWLKLEAGFNGNYNHENSPVTTREGTSPADQVIATRLFNRFIYNNNISALYVTLGGKVKNFSFSAGLRGEAWQVSTKSLEWDQERNDVPWFKKNNFALFPSAYLSYALPHDNEIQINYTRRIRRPWGGQLNSFRDIADPTNIKFGNPELQPQYSNSFELNYIKSWTYHMISLSAYLRTSDNCINRISYMDNGVMYTTHTNVARQANSGAEIVVKNNLFRSHLDLTTTINLYNNHISAWNYTVRDNRGNVILTPEGEPLKLYGEKQNSFAWDIRCMATVRLPWSLNFQATGRYSSKHLEAQGSHQGGWSVDAGLRRAFGDWSVSISCRDIFDSRKFKTTVNGVDYSQYAERWRGGRRLQVTIKYSFGNMKSKPSRNQRNQQSEPMDNSGYGGEEM